MVDRVRPLCLEQPLTGGTQTDFVPVEVDPTQDGVDARAFFAQNGTSADATAFLSRSAGDLTLTDGNAGTKRAQDLVSRVLGAQAAHASLLELTHFLDDGPGEGWVSGATLKITRTGPLITLKSWQTNSSASAVKILDVAYTYVAKTPLLATRVWTLYTASGSVARQMTDSYTYSGIMLAQVVRTWS